MEAEELELIEGVERESLLDAEPAQVWRALTDPDELGWLGDVERLDLEPGGELEIEVDGERRSGWVEEAEPGERLTVWWAAEGEESSRVSFELEPVDGGTRLRVVEARPLVAIDAAGGPFDAGGQAGGAAPQMLALAL